MQFAWLFKKMNRWSLLADLFHSPKQFAKAAQIERIMEYALVSSRQGLPDAISGCIPANATCLLMGVSCLGSESLCEIRQQLTKQLLGPHHLGAVCLDADFCATLNRRPDDSLEDLDSSLLVRARQATGPTHLTMGLDLFSRAASWRAVQAHLQDLGITGHTDLDKCRQLDPLLAGATGLPPLEAAAPLQLPAGVQDALVQRLVEGVLRCLGAAASTAGGRAGDGAAAGLLERCRVMAEERGEVYFREVLFGRGRPWSARQRHLMEMLQLVRKHVQEAGGGSSQLAVWAHNSHVGDARAADIGWRRGEVSLGQLAREQLPGGSTFSIGLSTHAGLIWAQAADAEAARRVPLAPSIEGSYEEVLHSCGLPAFGLDLRGPRLKEVLEFPMLERSVGRVYELKDERHVHYMDVSLPQQFDMVVHVDQVDG